LGIVELLAHGSFLLRAAIEVVGELAKLADRHMAISPAGLFMKQGPECASDEYKLWAVEPPPIVFFNVPGGLCVRAVAFERQPQRREACRGMQRILMQGPGDAGVARDLAPPVRGVHEYAGQGDAILARIHTENPAIR
jgi:hypothetical protein